MAYDHDLAERIRHLLGKHPEVTEKEMFGGICFLVNGNMVCGISKSDFMARLDPQKFGEYRELPDVRPMDFTGRPMKGYLFVNPDGVETEEQLIAWVDRCYTYASSLTPKKKK
jgi:hypothetical protein